MPGASVVTRFSVLSKFEGTQDMALYNQDGSSISRQIFAKRQVIAHRGKREFVRGWFSLFLGTFAGMITLQECGD